MTVSSKKSPPKSGTAGSHGLLLLNKKSGATSFDSLKCVKQAFATGKVGHTGTLDKFASGLLLLLVGRAVKLTPLFSGLSKEYTGTICFGAETDTLDPEGEVVAHGPIPAREDVEAVLDRFRGGILQAPPEYSAIHINGKRAHELVRSGQVPEMKKRPVTVYRLEIVSWTPPEAVIQVGCSAGTYIRSLARDIALAAGSRAHLRALERSKVGGFLLEDSVEDRGDKETLVNALRPLDTELFSALSVPRVFIGGKNVEDFGHGKPLEKIMAGMSFADENLTAGVFRENSPSDELLGIIERQNGKWIYRYNFAGN
jgi:tRNA pseudouridine55 synthase